MQKIHDKRTRMHPGRHNALWDGYYKRHRGDAAWGAVAPDQHVIDFVRHYRFPAETLILDCGCGHGKNAGELVRRGYQVHGVDVSPTSVEYSRANCPSAAFTVQDATSLRFADGSFDVVCDAGCMHVNEPCVHRQIIDGYHRVLRPGGHLFIRIFDREEGTDSTEPLFYVEDLPVYGYSLIEASELFDERRFRLDKTLFSSDYGPRGMHFLYLVKEP